MSLYQKLLAVQKAIRPVEKDGTNSFHKYRYASEAAVLSEVKPLLGEQGLVVIPSITHEETGFKPDGKSWAKVTICFRVIDADAPDQELESYSAGYAEDNGDKAIYKAITGATKYFYFKFFGIATSDDPENEKEKEIQKVNPTPAKQATGPKPVPNATQPETKEDPKLAAGKLGAMIGRLKTAQNLTDEQLKTYGQFDGSIRARMANGEVKSLEEIYKNLQEYVAVREKELKGA